MGNVNISRFEKKSALFNHTSIINIKDTKYDTK